MSSIAKKETSVPQPAAAPRDVTLERHRAGTVGLSSPAPRLSWRVPDAPAGWEQDRAEVSVRRTPFRELSADAAAGAPSIFSVDGAEQILVPWPDEPLESREAVTVSVRVHGAGARSPWSEPATFEAALLEPAEWTARMIGPGWDEVPGTDRRPPLIRTETEVRGDVVRARLHLTAHGLVEMEINGRRVGHDELVPGWTVYPARLPARSYDVTALVEKGPIALGAWLGDGWYRGHIGFDGGSYDNFGRGIGAMAQLEILLADGTVQTVATDESWTAGFGPILFSGLYEGETFDAREMPAGWSEPGFAGAEHGFSPVRLGVRDAATIVAPRADPVQCTAEIQPVSVEPRGGGRYLLDFGQNASGRLQLRIPAAPAGTAVTVKHAEVLEDGELGIRALRRAAATDTYTCAGSGPVEWEPRFTIHGFRYAEISGWPGQLDPDAVTFRVLHTRADRTGWFDCSHPGITKLHQNVVWSTRSNFVSIPTDCPQRDERLGWTGDIQAFAPTASFLFDLAPMISDWLRDLWEEQKKVDAGLPVYVPTIPGQFWDGKDLIAGWGDAAVFVPWALYRQTGDTAVLRTQLDSARRWVDDVQAAAGSSLIWDEGVQLGDWLDPAAPPDNPLKALTDAHLIATAYMARSTYLLAQMHWALGEMDEAGRREEQFEAIAHAFRERYVERDGRMESDTQAAYAMAITFDLLEPAQRVVAGDRLAELVRAADGNISTGFAGTPLVTGALTVTGHLAEAYLLLEQDSCPSWLYPVTMGATTTWERWDSMLPDGTVNPGDMTSINHYALGAVADWLHRTVAGLGPDDPGYATIRVAPRPGGSLTWARAAHETPYGLAVVEWHLAGDRLTVRGRIPVGAAAVLDLPGAAEEAIGHGTFERVLTV